MDLVRFFTLLIVYSISLQNLEKTNVSIDWDRYVDEDEAEGRFSVYNVHSRLSNPVAFITVASFLTCLCRLLFFRLHLQ